MHEPALLFLTQLLVFSLGQLFLGLVMLAGDRRRQHEREREKMAAAQAASRRALALQESDAGQTAYLTASPCPGLRLAREQTNHGGGTDHIPSSDITAGRVDGIFINIS